MSFLQNVRPDYIPAFLAKKDDLQLQREIILQHVLNTSLIFFLAAVGYWLYRTAWRVNQPVTWVVGGILLILALATFIRQLPYNLRAFLVMILIGAVGILDLLRSGLSGSGTIYLVTFAIIGGSLFGTRRGILTLVAVAFTQAVLGWLMVTRQIPMPDFSVLANSGRSEAWGISIFSTIYCAVILAGGVFQFTESLANTLKEARLLARNLDQERSQLENHIQQRTNELTRKAAQLEAARQVAARIASQTDIEPLLKTTVDVIREQFDLYHAGIFLPDESKEYAVLRAATGEAGRVLLERNHRLKIGEVGIVGYVMSKGEPRIAGNVDEDPAHYLNPILPETRSEMAVPIKLGDQTIGVLDVQSTRRNAFSSDDVDILLTLADQLSAALEKARLLNQYQKTVDELKQTAQQNTRLAWHQHLRNSRKRYAYRYRQMQVEPIPSNQVETEQILWDGSDTSNKTDGQSSTIKVPIKLRDQTIGIVNLKLATGQVTREMIDLVENAVGRMAVSLETVRLLEEIQARSERERLVGEIATRVRAATDIDSILRTTASELGKSLGVAEVIVQLAPNE